MEWAFKVAHYKLSSVGLPQIILNNNGAGLHVSEHHQQTSILGNGGDAGAI